MLRIYIDGFWQRRKLRTPPGLVVTRRLNEFGSEARFTLRLDAELERPAMGSTVLVRDDQQLLRQSNRLDLTPWTRTLITSITATWGDLPSQIGGLGYLWTITGSDASSAIANRTYLVEHPVAEDGTGSGAVETRSFIASVFVEKNGSSGGSVGIEARAFNGTPAETDEVILVFDDTDGTYTYSAGDRPVYVDDSDATWYRVSITLQMPPTSATETPYVEILLKPGDTATRFCCAQIAEVTALPLISGTWNEAAISWDEATMTWDAYAAAETWQGTGMTWDEAIITWADLGALYSLLPPYLDRSDVSANEFFGLLVERRARRAGDNLGATQIELECRAVDYRWKFARTYVTESYTDTPADIVADLQAKYFEYLGYRVTLDPAWDFVPVLTIDWQGRSLDQALNDLCIRLGMEWRITTEAVVEVKYKTESQNRYTFGDANNLLVSSNALDNSDVWNPVLVLATITPTARKPLPIGFRGRAFLVEDANAGQVGLVVQSPPWFYDGAALDDARSLGARIYVRKGSATNTIVALELNAYDSVSALLGAETVRLNADTGALSMGGSATEIADAEGGAWYELLVEMTVPAGTAGVALAFYPAAFAAISGGSADASLTGEVEVCHAQVYDGEGIRYIETEALPAYPNQRSKWILENNGYSLADLANRITVKSDEAGTYAHTANETSSQGETWGPGEAAPIIDSTIDSNGTAASIAESELALKSYPRESIAISVWNRPNLDVGQIVTAADAMILQHRAAAQVVQVYTLTAIHPNQTLVRLECAPFVAEKVIRPLRRVLNS